MPPHKRGPAASVAEMDDMARGIEMTDLRDDNARLRGCATRPRQAVAAAGLYNMDKKDEVKQLCRDLCSVDYTVGVSQLRNADSSLDLYTNKPELAALCHLRHVVGWLSVGGSESLSRPSRRSRCPCSPPPPRCSPGRTTSRALHLIKYHTACSFLSDTLSHQSLLETAAAAAGANALLSQEGCGGPVGRRR